MSGLHGDSERPPQALSPRETPSEESRRHEEGAARAALKQEAQGRPRTTDAGANLQSLATVRAWGAVFGQGRGRPGGSPGLILLLLVVVFAVIAAMIAAVA